MVGQPVGCRFHALPCILDDLCCHEIVNMVVERGIDDLVQSVSLHIPRQFLFHGYILPFLTLYGCWLYGWLCVYGVEEYYEAGLIGVAVIGLVQILSCLCCHWSVHVQCFLTCKSVSILREVTQFKSYRDVYFFTVRCTTVV